MSCSTLCRLRYVARNLPLLKAGRKFSSTTASRIERGNFSKVQTWGIVLLVCCCWENLHAWLVRNNSAFAESRAGVKTVGLGALAETQGLMITDKVSNEFAS